MDRRPYIQRRRPRCYSSMESSEDEPCNSAVQVSLPTVLYTTSETETDRGFSSESKTSLPSLPSTLNNLESPAKGQTSSSLPTSPSPYDTSNHSLSSSGVSMPSQTSCASYANCGSATGNPRNKCALQPGHSLMDWIRLGNSGKDLTGVCGRIRPVSLEELARHNTQNDAWLAIRGRVYNITHYLSYHPGGPDELMRGAGIDATQLFDKVHPWVNYDSLLAKCLVGPLRCQQLDADEIFGSCNPSPKSDRLREPSKAQELVRKSMENLANCITPVRKKVTKPDEGNKNSPPSRIMQCLIQSSDLPVSISRRAASSPVKKVEQTSDGRPPPLRYDWIQTSMKLTISLYTGTLANPGGCASLVEGGLLIEVATDGWLRTIKLVPEAKLQDALQLRVYAESGKLEVIALKEHPELWKSCGELIQGEATKVSSPRSVACTVVRVEDVTHDTKLISLTTKQGPVVVPLGHHVRIHRPIEGAEVIRSYTPIGDGWSGNVNDVSSIKLAVKKYDSGALSPHLASLATGDSLTLSGPYGNFQLHSVKSVKTVVFLAAGTGITPMLGLIKFMLLRTNPKCDQLHLLFFNKTERDILFKLQFEDIEKEDNRLLTTHILSQPSTSWTGQKGRISSDLLTTVVVNDILKCRDVCTHLALVCGPTEFTHTAIDTLKKLGLKESCVHAFLG